MSTLLEECMRALKEALKTPRGIADSFDETKAKELLLALHVEGEVLAFNDVKAVALAAGWSEPRAARLAQLAQKVRTRRRMITWNRSNWGVPAVARIKERLAGGWAAG